MKVEDFVPESTAKDPFFSDILKPFDTQIAELERLYENIAMLRDVADGTFVPGKVKITCDAFLPKLNSIICRRSLPRMLNMLLRSLSSRKYKRILLESSNSKIFFRILTL